MFLSSSSASNEICHHSFYRTPNLLQYLNTSQDFVNYFNNNICDHLFRNEPEINELVSKLMTCIHTGLLKRVERYMKNIQLFETYIAFELFTNVLRMMLF